MSLGHFVVYSTKAFPVRLLMNRLKETGLIFTKFDISFKETLRL